MSNVEPWLRNTHSDLDAVRRQIVHALELTAEDCARWSERLSEEELNTRAYELPSVAFQMRHITRSLDRLLTYAEGGSLSDEQRTALTTEMNPVSREQAFFEFKQGMSGSLERILCFWPEQYEEVRYVGRDRLPTTAGALLIHCAEHTQRHAGQMVTTAKLVLAIRTSPAENRAEVN